PPPKGYKPPPKPAVFDPYLSIDIALQELQQQPQELDWRTAFQATPRPQPTPSPQAEQSAEPEAEVAREEREPPAAPQVERTAEERRHFELMNGIGSLRAEMQERDEQPVRKFDAYVDLSQRLDHLGRQYEDLRNFLGAPRRIVRDAEGRAVGSVVDFSLE